MYSIERSMARLCNRLMENAQTSLNELTYTLDEMAYNAEQNPEREDIQACMQEIKEKIKSSVSEHWAILNKWAEHFDGISEADEEDSPEDGDDLTDDEGESEDDEAGDENGE